MINGVTSSPKNSGMTFGQAGMGRGSVSGDARFAKSFGGDGTSSGGYSRSSRETDAPCGAGSCRDSSRKAAAEAKAAKKKEKEEAKRKRREGRLLRPQRRQLKQAENAKRARAARLVLRRCILRV